MSINGLHEKVLQWFENYNPFEDEGLYASGIYEMWLVGSRARGTERPDSDYDVAVIFPAELRDENEIEKSSLQLSEIMHSGLGFFMPEYKGCKVDIQIFFSDDPVLKEYSKEAIAPKRKMPKKQF